MDCIFCKVVNKEVENNVLYEDDLVIAFDDISPKAPVHKLIIPKKHISTINDLEETDTELVGHMIQVAKKLAKDLNIDEEGYRLTINCNAGGGQAVFHIHLHLLGGRPFKWPPG